MSPSEANSGKTSTARTRPQESATGAAAACEQHPAARRLGHPVREPHVVLGLRPARQQEDVDRLRAYENTIIPEDFDYSVVDGLSNEVKQKLMAARPQTLARAARISGITPAAISLLLVYLKKQGLLRKSA